jgi:hypothetical protein
MCGQSVFSTSAEPAAFPGTYPMHEANYAQQLLAGVRDQKPDARYASKWIARVAILLQGKTPKAAYPSIRWAVRG